MRSIKINLNGWYKHNLSSFPFMAGAIISPERINDAWLSVVEKDTYIDEYGNERFCCEWIGNEIIDQKEVFVAEVTPKRVKGRPKKEIEIFL